MVISKHARGFGSQSKVKDDDDEQFPGPRDDDGEKLSRVCGKKKKGVRSRHLEAKPTASYDAYCKSSTEATLGLPSQIVKLSVKSLVKLSVKKSVGKEKKEADNS